MEFPRREFLVVWASLTDDFGERPYDRHIRPREPHGHLARAALSAGHGTVGGQTSSSEILWYQRGHADVHRRH